MAERTCERSDDEPAEPTVRADGGQTTAQESGEGYRARTVPDDVGELFRIAYGTETRPGTLGTFVEDVRRSAKGTDLWPIELDNLCLVSGDSRFLLRDGEETYAFRCVLDVLMAPWLLPDSDGPFEVESTTPDEDATITAELAGTDIDVNPEETVMSLGAARAIAQQPDGGFVPAVAYAQLCTYINAFPNRAAYEAWAEETPEAATMALPLTEGFDLARELVARE